MPLQDCTQDGKPGLSYGPEGTCYIYNPKDQASKEVAREKAAKQGRAIEISKVRKSSP